MSTSALLTYFGTNLADIETNRRGQLTAAQRHALQADIDLNRQTMGYQGCGVVFAILLVSAIVGFIALSGLANDAPPEFFLILGGAVGLVALLILIGFISTTRRANTDTRRLQNATIQTVRGPVELVVSGSDAAGYPHYAIKIGRETTHRAVGRSAPFDRALFKLIDPNGTYQAYLVAGRLLGMEQVGGGSLSNPIYDDARLPLGDVFHFDYDDLQANRNGKLSAAQLWRIRIDHKNPWRGCGILIALLSTVVWIPPLVALLSDAFDALLQELGLVLLAGAGLIVLLIIIWQILRAGARADLQRGTVQQAIGTLTKKQYLAGDAETNDSWLVTLDDTVFHLREVEYHALQEGRRYHFYYYKTHDVVSVEPLDG